VKLVQQDLPPYLQKLFARVRGLFFRRGPRRAELQLPKRELHFPVCPLVPRLGSEGALVALQVELTLPGFQAPGVLGDLLEERERMLLRHGSDALQIPLAGKALQVLLPGSAASVADAIHQKAPIAGSFLTELLF
jgi:hypothetical protein